MLQIMAKSKNKPLSFSTTMRNPERIAGFLSQLVEFENEILTTDVIYKIISNVIKNKLYYTMYEYRNPMLKNIYESYELSFTDQQVEEIINNSPQNHKEAGFENGWESRFDTWFQLPEEFGFVLYEKNQKLKISKLGHMLIDAYNQEDTDEKQIQSVFLNCLCKYQSNNPFKKNLNSNVPLLLLLKTIKLLKEDLEENNAGIFRSELSLFICWPNSDERELYKLIKKIRKEVGYNYSDEYMYDICLELLGCKTAEEKEENKKYFKIGKICNEAVDEYIRKMRSTGILSLRGNGRFLDFNSFEEKKIKYILNKYSTFEEFDDKEKYFNYIGSIDHELFDIQQVVDHTKEMNVKLNTLNEYATKFSKDEIFEELIILTKKVESKNQAFKYIPEPTRLEFLTSISLVQNLECYVEPNYSIDDEGLPTMTARGNMPDIICSDPHPYNIIDEVPLYANVEVTLMRGKTDQVTNEIVPIRRHLLTQINEGKNAFAIFIAPNVHEDTKEISEWYKHKDNVDIKTFTIQDIVEKLNKDKRLAAYIK